MSSLEAAGGIGGETAADGNPFSLPDLDAAGADDETAHMTAGQRVGLGYGIADQGSAASDSAGGHSRLPAQAAALENAPSAKGKQSHGTSEVRDHYAARSVEPSSASESNCVCRGAPLVTTHEGERGSRVHSAAAQDDAAQPAAWVPSSKTAHQALFPPALDSAIQRGEQTGGGIDPLTGMPEKRKRWTKQDKLAAWDKAKQIPGQDATKIRQDVTGRTLHWNDYGKETVGCMQCMTEPALCAQMLSAVLIGQLQQLGQSYREVTVHGT